MFVKCSKKAYIKERMITIKQAKKILLFLFVLALLGLTGNAAASTLSLKNIKIPAKQKSIIKTDIKMSFEALTLLTRSTEVPVLVRMTNYTEGNNNVTSWYPITVNNSTLKFSDTKDWILYTNTEIKTRDYYLVPKNFDGEVWNY